MEHPLRAHCKEMSRKGILVDSQLLIAGRQEGGIAGGMHSGLPGGQEGLPRERCAPGRKLPGIDMHHRVHATIPGNSASFRLFHSPSGPALATS